MFWGKIYRSLALTLLLNTAALAHAQTGSTTVDLETCTVGSVTEEQGVLIMACNYTGSVQEVFSRAPYSSGRALLTIAIPGAGSYFTPTGRAWLPRDWAYFQDTGNAHALDPAPLTSPTGCPAFDAAWMGHIVYQATVGLPDVTWSVWAGPDGTACWQRS